jgi:hypothetical protein
MRGTIIERVKFDKKRRLVDSGDITPPLPNVKTYLIDLPVIDK